MKTINSIATLAYWDGKFKSQAFFSYEIEAQREGEAITLLGKTSGWNTDKKAQAVVAPAAEWEGYTTGRPTGQMREVVRLAVGAIVDKLVFDRRFPIPAATIEAFIAEICGDVGDNPGWILK